jgi:nitroreductase
MTHEDLAMMTTTTLDAIFGRRSVRAYLKKEISAETITTLLQAAMAAPSACAKDPWRFIVVREPKTLAALASGLPNGTMLADAPLGIVICGDQSAAHDGQTSYMLQDCSAAIQNILLAAHALGLGACWLGVHPREDRMRHIKNIVGLPEPVVPVSCIALGYPAEKKGPRTRYDETYVHWEMW